MTKSAGSASADEPTVLGHKPSIPSWFNARILSVLCTVLVIVGSVANEALDLPEIYFARKHNLVNIYMTKFAWAWTTIPLSAYIVTHSLSSLGSHLPSALLRTMRIWIASVAWKVVTSIFEFIHAAGTCSDISVPAYRDCVEKGHSWIGTDISGHCFLLTFASLLIASEIEILSHEEHSFVCKLRRRVSFNGASHIPSTQGRTHSTSAQLHTPMQFHFLSYYIAPVLRIALVSLIFLWSWNLLVTASYYHTSSEKIGGLVIAIFCWFLLYRLTGVVRGFSRIAQGDGGVMDKAE